MSRYWLGDWLYEHGIEFVTPLLEISSEEEVKMHLRLLSLSPKSLEYNYMFADSFSVPSDDLIVGYYNKKKGLAESIINFIMTGEIQQF